MRRGGLRRPPPTWQTLWMSLWVIVCASIPAAAARADMEPTQRRECELKAAFIYNFTKFIEWPPRSFADGNAPFVIGIVGNSPCTGVLESMVEQRRVGERRIEVHPVRSAAELLSVQLLYVGAGEEQALTTWSGRIDSLPLVTVGESPEFASGGGAITLRRQDDKVRFEINVRSAEHSGVKLSSQLLKLAMAVRRES
jgi:hypothetical protein